MSPLTTASPTKVSLASRNGQITRSRRRVSPPLLATGLVVVVLCALAVGSLYSGAAHRELVLAVARPVPTGTAIVDADLRDVEVAAGPGAATVLASKRHEVVGRRPAVALVWGALLAPGQLSSGSGLAAGQALVALALRPGQFPPELVPGDAVRVLSARAPAAAVPGALVPVTGDAGSPPPDPASPAPDSAVLADATVVSLRPVIEAPGTTVVSLRLPEAAAPGVLRAGSSGAVGLVVTGGTK